MTSRNVADTTRADQSANVAEGLNFVCIGRPAAAMPIDARTTMVEWPSEKKRPVE